MTERPPERPGRYQRSTSGLMAALLVTVLAVVGFVGFRSLNRDDLQVKPEAVDYLETVEVLQGDGGRPVYPARLPEGWMATSVDVAPGTVSLAWGVGLLTDDREFIGVRQSGRPLAELLDTYVDEQTTQGEPVTIDSAVASTWDTFADAGGDRAYVAEVDGETVMVFGSASEEDLRTVVESLSTDAL